MVLLRNKRFYLIVLLVAATVLIGAALEINAGYKDFDHMQGLVKIRMFEGEEVKITFPNGLEHMFEIAVIDAGANNNPELILTVDGEEKHALKKYDAVQLSDGTSIRIGQIFAGMNQGSAEIYIAAKKITIRNSQ